MGIMEGHELKITLVFSAQRREWESWKAMRRKLLLFLVHRGKNGHHGRP